MATVSLVSAAQYLRMSTEHQQYSLENQSDANLRYATANGFTVVKTYADAGKSGLNVKNRAGLIQLLKDVVGGTREFAAILVYDVSRWGRFQDADEGAHYEFLCKQAGIPVHYCAETFVNDGTISSALLKALKRSMAAEYSRELGVKTYAGKKRLAELGFWAGAQSGYGLRRMIVGPDGQRKQKLKDQERKNIKTDRIILVPGPTHEVEWVRKIFTMALRKPIPKIVTYLNSHGAKFLDGRPWRYDLVYRLLKRPKYAGFNVWGRTRQELKGKRTVTNPAQWILKPNAFFAIVDWKLFERVQAVIKKRRAPKTDQELLCKVKRLLAAKGALSADIIDKAKGVSQPSTYKAHFGSLKRVYDLVGYRPSQRQLMVSAHQGRSARIRSEILNEIENLFTDRVQRFRLKDQRLALMLEDGLTVIPVVARYYVTRAEKLIRWELIPRRADREAIILLCLSNAAYDGIQSYYIMRGLNTTTEYQIKGETDPWLARGQRLRIMSDFYTAVSIAAHDYRSPTSVDILPVMRRRKVGALA